MIFYLSLIKYVFIYVCFYPIIAIKMKGEESWKMFRGNMMRTGISASRLSKQPHLLWITELGPIVSSPVVNGGIAYILTITGRIFAVNAYKRQVNWHVNIGCPMVSSPLLYNDRLISSTFDTWIKETRFLGKNFVFALDAKTGGQIWSVELEADIFSSPCLIEEVIVVGTMNNILLAIDIDGNLKWEFITEGAIWSSPASNGNEIFVGSDDGFLYCLNLDGKLLWKTKLKGKVRSSPCLSEYDLTLFVGTQEGSLYCINQNNGSIRWEKQITKPISCSAALSKDRVYLGASDNKIYCFSCDSGIKVWEFETFNKIWSSPSISENDEALFFGSLDSHIYGLDVKTGNQNWKFPTMNMIDSSPSISNNMLFVGGRDGLLYIFGPKRLPSYIK